MNKSAQILKIAENTALVPKYTTALGILSIQIFQYSHGISLWYSKYLSDS